MGTSLVDLLRKVRHYSSRMVTSRFVILMWFSCLFTCLFASAGEKTWIEVTSPHFRVLSDGGDRDARRVAREFEQMRTVFSGGFPDLRLESGAPLLVLAPRDENSMRNLAPQFWKQKGAKPAGYFQHGWEKQFAVVRLDQVAPAAYQVVYHEYTHTLLHMNFRWFPVWLDEGLADFYGNTRFEQSQMLVGAAGWRTRELQTMTPIPLETLISVDRQSPYYHDEDKVGRFYAEAWGLTHFLTFGPGMEQGKRLNKFYALLQQGTEQKKAFQQVFGDFPELQKSLEEYFHKFTLPTWVLKNPPQIDEKTFAVRRITKAETEAELGGFHLWSHDLADARPLIEEAAKDDPKLALAHENMGFLDFADGKDQAASRAFTQAYELDERRFLSLFYKTMLSPLAQSDAPGDQAGFHDALLKTIHLNPQFAPAYVELSRLAVRQGNLTIALALARKAEQLEPSRAGYHLLSGQIMLRLGRGAEAATFAKYVADRWYGPDHDEAVELWNSVPVGQRPTGDQLSEMGPAETQTVEGRLKSANCGDKDHGMTVELEHSGQALSFHTKGGWLGGFSDTLWYGADHFSYCHHIEGLRAAIRYKSPSDKTYTGDLVEVELRQDLPASAVLAKPDDAKPETRQ
jgi:Tfp pilus assembly protein PilF